MPRPTERAVSTQRVFLRRALIAAVLVIIGASIAARAQAPSAEPAPPAAPAGHSAAQS